MLYFRAAIIIFTTAVVGGAIAFLGNQLGRYVGRKKLSVFKLRPRYTSMLITVLTGMMIASCTLLLAIVVSEPVRITIINPRQYAEKVHQLEAKIEHLSKLEQSIPIYKFEDTILSVVIKPSQDKVKMESALKEVIAKANQAAIEKSKRVAKDRGESFDLPPGGRLVGYMPQNLDAVARELSRLDQDQVIFARAYKNATLGDQFPVQLGKPIPNSLIFSRGETILKITINGQEDYYNIYSELNRIMRMNVSQIAIYKGIFPNPDDGTVGEANPEKLKKLAEEIRKRKKAVTVEFFAGGDTHIMGPLPVDFAIRE